MEPRSCTECGFVADDYDRNDAIGTLRAVPHMWNEMTAGIGDDALATVAAQAAIVGAIAAEATTFTRTTVDDQRALELVHAATHELRAAGRALHAAGAGAPTQVGRLAQVSSSSGGVPKAALPGAVVDRRGVVGDVQRERLHHGRPMQALSLWAIEVIDGLRGEGHPISPGAAGENLTLAGIDWATIRPGVRLSIGPVVAEISAYATPCTKNARWFADGDFGRIDHDRHPGSSRAYAWVLEGGPVAPGDEVVVEPARDFTAAAHDAP
jgi:MOSC domain-containing protein YiiM